MGVIPAAVISAAVAAWVAVTVLNRSNTHQKELAGQQLALQKRESTDVRRKAVMADLMGAASGFVIAAGKGTEEVQAQTILFETATYRWVFEVDSPEQREEILAWDELLWEPAWHLALFKDTPKDVRGEWSVFLNEAIGAFVGIGTELVTGRAASAPEISESMRTKRKNLASRWHDELSALTPGAGAEDPSSADVTG